MITIVGATGNVGGKTAEYLLNAGIKVRLIARNADKLKTFETRGAEIMPGDTTDVDFLTRAFIGSDIVFTMIPSDYGSSDIGAFQDKIGKAQAEAIKRSGIKRVLHLSALGGHTEENTGIIGGVARQEKRYDALQGVHVKHLRPTYFMENHFNSIPVIKGNGINGNAMLADKPFPMIASRDIARVAADILIAGNFEGKTVQPLLGARSYTMNEATAILGKAIGKPDLAYVQFPYADTKAGMEQSGISASVAGALVDMIQGGNEHDI